MRERESVLRERDRYGVLDEKKGSFGRGKNERVTKNFVEKFKVRNFRRSPELPENVRNF